jgi:hypothetical protein
MNKIEIDNLCKEYNITNYTINDDGSIDIDGDVDLAWHKILKIPLKFNKVTGHFYCNSTDITSLEGVPKYVGGNFTCWKTNITSLKGAPQKVGGNFSCSYTKITSLKGLPEYIGGNIWCIETNINMPEIDSTNTGKLVFLSPEVDYWFTYFQKIYRTYIQL